MSRFISFMYRHDRAVRIALAIPRDVWAKRAYIAAALMTAFFSHTNGWNARLDAGMTLSCPRTSHYSKSFLEQVVQERLKLPQGSVLLRELDEYDRIRQDGWLCQSS